MGVVDIGAFEVNNTANGGTFVAALPAATINTSYSAQITANNGAFTYSMTSGNAAERSDAEHELRRGRRERHTDASRHVQFHHHGHERSQFERHQLHDDGGERSHGHVDAYEYSDGDLDQYHHVDAHQYSDTYTHRDRNGYSYAGAGLDQRDDHVRERDRESCTAAVCEECFGGEHGGSPPVGPVITGTPGTYVLTGFGAGSYTIKPTKPGGVNGAITSNDAARVAQGVSRIGAVRESEPEIRLGRERERVCDFQRRGVDREVCRGADGHGECGAVEVLHGESAGRPDGSAADAALQRQPDLRFGDRAA